MITHLPGILRQPFRLVVLPMLLGAGCDATSSAESSTDPLVDSGSEAGQVDSSVADDPESCPTVATACPSTCEVLSARPLRPPNPACFATPPDVLGCYDGSIDRILEEGCVRAGDGTLYTGFSTTLASPLIASGNYERCSPADRARLETATSCSDSGAN